MESFVIGSGGAYPPAEAYREAMPKIIRQRKISQLSVVAVLVISSVMIVSGFSASPAATSADSPLKDYDWAQQLEHVGLVGCLLVAVYTLWKSLGSERALNASMTKTVTEALAGSAASNIELRKSNQDLQNTIMELKDALRSHNT